MNDRILSNMLSAMDAAARFSAMSDRDLVAECLNSEAADYLVVIEMMDRLDPGWSSRPTSPPPKPPGRPAARRTKRTPPDGRRRRF